jgi:acyl-CoA thioesterase
MMKSPADIVNLMLENDAYSNWLGISVNEVNIGFCKISLQINLSMLNGFQIAHGGISYALADSCLAFAANSFGNKAVSIDTTISHLKKVSIGDVLTAESELVNKGKKVGVYLVHIKNQENERVALFKGHVHFSSEIW